MSQIKRVHDLSLPELGVYARLTEARLRNDPGQQLFIAEGLPVIESALNMGYEPVSFLMEQRHIDGKAACIIKRCPDTAVYTADDEVLAQLTGYRLTRGVLCAMRRKALPEVGTVCRDAERLCVLESVSDSTNVGAIFRSCAALGADAVLLSPDCCDPLCRRSVRVSMGAVFRLPWTYFSAWLHGGLNLLKEYGFLTIALALTDDSVPLDGLKLQPTRQAAFIFGSEGHGLSAVTVKAADMVVRIPMFHGVDSLNVAASAAVVFWHTRRELRGHK